MAHREGPGGKLGAHFFGQLQKPQDVRDGGALAAKAVREILLGQAMLLDQPPIALGLLERSEILTLQVLDERDRKGRRFAQILDQRRDFVEPGPLGGSPTALSRDQRVPVPGTTQQNRLENTLLADRLRELLEPLRIEVLARLFWIA